MTWQYLPVTYRKRCGKVIAEIENENKDNSEADKKTASALSIAHYDMRFLKPLDEALLKEIAKKFDCIITIEDGVRKGGSWIRHTGMDERPRIPSADNEDGYS